LQQHGLRRQLRQDGGEARREAGVIDDPAGLGVGEQIEQLCLDVTVVDVERRDPRLVRADHALEVLVPL
jgi:hypothetical protein